jgi:pimeloyl-ACP methyl ester carboxylesterase
VRDERGLLQRRAVHEQRRGRVRRADRVPVPLRIVTRPARVAHTLTDDGWRLALHVYEPPPGATSRRHPVLLCHGLAANHIAFDVHADVSLARHLARRGYLAIAVDLRGHGHSEHPTTRRPRRFGWSFDDYLERDVPAAIAFAKTRSGASAVHWIGHSMGGILGYAHLAGSGWAPRARGEHDGRARRDAVSAVQTAPP